MTASYWKIYFCVFIIVKTRFVLTKIEKISSLEYYTETALLFVTFCIFGVGTYNKYFVYTYSVFVYFGVRINRKVSIFYSTC